MKNFKNLQEFSGYLTKLESRYRLAEIEALSLGAQHIQEEAKRKFGVYQDAVGQYPAWPELKENTQAQRERLGFEPNNPLYMTGKLANSINYHVTAPIAQIGSDSDLMVYHENGTKTIPPRPVLGPAAFESKEKVGEIFAKVFVAWLKGKTI